MKYRKLGSTGITISEISFGAWGIGGGQCSYGQIDDHESLKALKKAFEKGITLFDTSDSYGDGHSEKLIGKALKKKRNSIILATKVGCLLHGGREMPQDFSKKHIRKSIEASLKRLQTDYIDIYQLHSPLMEVLKDGEAMNTLHDLKKEGKIRFFGISVRSPQDGIDAIKKYQFESVQINFNLIDHRAIESGLFYLAKKEGVGIIVRTPFCFGFLTGKYSEEMSFAKNDHRLNWPKSQLKRWADASKLFNTLCQKNGQTHAQFALKFCLAYDNVSSVIPGMMNEEHVKENAAASELQDLSPEELMEIQKIYQNNVFFDFSLRRESDKKSDK